MSGLAEVVYLHRYLGRNNAGKTGCRGCVWRTDAPALSERGKREHAAHVAEAVTAWLGSETEIERLCEVMHDAYEAAAVEAGWETQERSRKPWGDVPPANQSAMRVALRAAIAAITEQATP